MKINIKLLVIKLTELYFDNRILYGEKAADDINTRIIEIIKECLIKEDETK